MTRIASTFKLAVATLLFVAAPALSQEDSIDDLLARLADPKTEDWEVVERRIWAEWSRSGSASMDLLLERGRKAMEDGNIDAAIEHLTALTDHAPDFAEGWNARATAFYQADRYGESIQDIRRTLALNPDHFGALSGLGMMLDELGFEEEALDIYRRAVDLNPHRPNLDAAIERLEKQTGGASL